MAYTKDDDPTQKTGPGGGGATPPAGVPSGGGGGSPSGGAPSSDQPSPGGEVPWTRPPTKKKGSRGRAVGHPGPADPVEKTDPLPDPVKTPEPVPAPTFPEPLTPRPKKPRKDPPSRTDIFKRQKTPLPAFWGKRRLRGAHIAYERVLPNGAKLVCYWWSWGPINSLANFSIDGRTLTQLGLSSGTNYNIYLGSGSSAADAIMAAHEPLWATVPQPADVAQMIVLFNRPSDRFPPVDVRQIECDGEGLLVRDPRTDPTLVTRYYRDNMMLAVADFETDDRFGGSFPDEAEDWTAIGTAATDVEEDLGSGRLRYSPIGIELTQTGEYDAILDDMRGHAALNVSYNGGKRYWWMDKWRAADGITFTDLGSEANIIGVSPLTVKGGAEIPTRVIVKFTNEAAGWKEDFAVDEHPSLASGAVDLVEWSYDYFGIRTYDHAKRLAKLIRKRNSVDKGAVIRVMASGLRVVPGSRVTITNATQLNWSGVDVLVHQVAPVVDKSSFDLTLEVWSDSVHDDTAETTTSYVPPANPSPYDVPPEIVGVATGGGGLYWLDPEVRSSTIYGTAFWTATNLGSYDGAKVNDLVLTVACFNWNVAGDSNLKFDAGVGNTKTFREITFSYTALTNNPVIQYSDDGAAWTSVSFIVGSVTVVAGAVTTVTKFWDSVGAHRHWRFAKSNALAQASTFTEIQFREYTGPYLYLAGYKIYNTFTGTPLLEMYIPANRTPTAGEPMSLDPFRWEVLPTFIAGGSFGWNIRIATVSTSGLESAGVDWGVLGVGGAANARSEYVRQAESSLVLVSGNNNNIPLDSGPTMNVISGPAAAFAITGFDAGAATGGEVIRLRYNGVRACTFADNHASSSAANRIRTDRGDVTTVAGAFTATLWRVNAESLWVLDVVRDTAGYK